MGSLFIVFGCCRASHTFSCFLTKPVIRFEIFWVKLHPASTHRHAHNSCTVWTDSPPFYQLCCQWLCVKHDVRHALQRGGNITFQMGCGLEFSFFISFPHLCHLWWKWKLIPNVSLEWGLGVFLMVWYWGNLEQSRGHTENQNIWSEKYFTGTAGYNFEVHELMN